jgi:light-regulated signal transduction histidine kinase (bacteriophytochrome)
MPDVLPALVDVDLRDAHSLNAALEQRVRERTIELEQAVKDLESFTYSVAHDLRAPLRAIDGYALALAEDFGAGLDAEAQRYLDLVRENAQRLGELIDGLLRLSRLGREDVIRVRFSMEKAVEQAITELGDGRQWVVHDELPAGFGDPTLITVVLRNLLGNAIKFSRNETTPRIEVTAEEIDGETVWRIHDNGVGFDMQYAGKLFGVFQRLHRLDEFEGSGLGLAIAQRIVERHSGRIWAQSERGKGATFSFTLGVDHA